jgi:tRNA splicing endonuclease
VIIRFKRNRKLCVIAEYQSFKPLFPFQTVQPLRDVSDAVLLSFAQHHIQREHAMAEDDVGIPRVTSKAGVLYVVERDAATAALLESHPHLAPRQMSPDAPLQLSVYDAWYLQRRGRLVFASSELEGAMRRAIGVLWRPAAVYEHLALREHMRLRADAVAYGAHFLAYAGDGSGSGHASFLVFCVSNAAQPALSLVGMERAAHGVGKRALVATTTMGADGAVSVEVAILGAKPCELGRASEL